MIPFAELKKVGFIDRKIIRKSLKEVTRSGHFIGGPVLERFECEFAEFLGVQNVVAVGNGLDALRLTLEAWGIGEGDEVLVPAFTYFATWLAVSMTGATLVPVDVRLKDATLDPSLLRQAITPKTKAIIPVHLYGHTADMASIIDIAAGQEILVLEDAAQAHGAYSNGHRAGSMGHAGAFSFYPTKNLGGLGDGGAVATNSTELAEVLRSLRNYGTGTNKFDFRRLGVNSRLDSLQAAYLSQRLLRLETENELRRTVVSHYRRKLDSAWGTLIGPSSLTDSVWHVASVLSPRREEFVKKMSDLGVTTDIHYPYSICDFKSLLKMKTPCTDQECIFPIAKRLSEGVVSLPLGRWVSKRDVKLILRALDQLGELEHQAQLGAQSD
jgi:dTDP-3-amino-3,4,6-trideoxy-alpha-D-glucose transaminase